MVDKKLILFIADHLGTDDYTELFVVIMLFESTMIGSQT